MQLKSLSPELEELRNVILSSNLTSCFLILEELTSAKKERLFFDTCFIDKKQKFKI